MDDWYLIADPAAHTTFYVSKDSPLLLPAADDKLGADNAAAFASYAGFDLRSEAWMPAGMVIAIDPNAPALTKPSSSNVLNLVRGGSDPYAMNFDFWNLSAFRLQFSMGLPYADDEYEEFDAPWQVDGHIVANLFDPGDAWR